MKQNIQPTLTAEQLKVYFPHLSTESLNELVGYYKDLNTLAIEEVSIQFNNKGKEHATCVMAKLFETSHSHVKIFAHSFNGEISNNSLYLEKLQYFLNKRDSNIEVIFEQNPNKHSEALKKILEAKRSKKSGQVKVSVACKSSLEQFKTYLVDPNKGLNFTLGDHEEKGFNKYRCETDTNKYTAILNYDDVKFCATLNSMFEILTKDAVEIQE